MNFENFNFNNLNELTFGNLIQNESDAEKFVTANNLVSMSPPNCPTCWSEMRMEKTRGKPSFRCKKKICRKRVSPFNGTWFEKSKLTKLQILKLVFLFCNRRPVTVALKIAEVAWEAAINWFKVCREVCQIINQNQPFTSIGGPNLTVEIDETVICRRKYHRGRVLRKQTQWIFTGVCRESKRVFVIPVNTRGARTLVPLIKHYVGVPDPECQSKITIFTDGWSSYKGLSRLGYNHGVVIHGKNFLNPADKNIHTQTVERLNLSLKKFLPVTTNATLLESHLHQFLYFRRLRGKSVGEIFQIFIQDIIKVFPGYNQIGMKAFISKSQTPNLHEGFIA